MSNLDNCELLKNDLKLIKNENLRNFVEFVFDNCPKIFFKLPASTTGKHHPSYALGEGGLTRHVAAAVKIASSLLDLELFEATDEQKDLIISSLLLHDCVKTGFTEDLDSNTVFEHPLLACQLIDDCYSKNSFDLSEELIDDLKRLISSHMGQWNTDKDGNEILPKPIEDDEKFVHICDYLASKKFIEVKL